MVQSKGPWLECAKKASFWSCQSVCDCMYNLIWKSLQRPTLRLFMDWPCWDPLERILRKLFCRRRWLGLPCHQNPLVGLPREQIDMVQPLKLGYPFICILVTIHPFIYLSILSSTYPSTYSPIHPSIQLTNQPVNNQTNQPSNQPTHICWTIGTYSKLRSVLIARDTLSLPSLRL